MMAAVIVLLAQAAWLLVGSRCAAALTKGQGRHPGTDVLMADVAAAFVLVLGILLFWPLLFAGTIVKDNHRD